jgi:hypothetical protein
MPSREQPSWRRCSYLRWRRRSPRHHNEAVVVTLGALTLVAADRAVISTVECSSEAGSSTHSEDRTIRMGMDIPMPMDIRTGCTARVA